MERLGLNKFYFHFIVSQAEASFFMWKESVREALKGDADQIRECLERLARIAELDADAPLKRQWENYLNYVLTLQEAGHTKDSLRFIRGTVECTMGDPFEMDLEKGQVCLGKEEIQFLIMFLSELLEQDGKNQETVNKTERMVRALFTYIDARFLLDREKAILFSRLAAMEIHYFGEDKRFLPDVKKAVSYLRKTQYLCDIPGLLKYLSIYEEAESDRIKYEKQGQALLQLKEEFAGGYRYQAETIYYDMPRISEIREFLASARVDLHYSQEELSDGICAPESYSRIESGKRKPHKENLEKILSKLGLTWGYYSGKIVTSSYECQLLSSQLSTLMHYDNYEEAKELLNILREKLDAGIVQNQQFFASNQAILDRRTGQLSGEQLEKDLWKHLKLTGASLEMQRFFSPSEEKLLYQLELVYLKKLKQPDKAIAIAKAYIENEERKFLKNTYSIRYHMNVLADIYSQTKQWEKEERISLKCLTEIFETGVQADLIEQFLDTLADSFLLRNENSRAKEYIAQAVYMADLYLKEKNGNLLKHGYSQLFQEERKWY